MLHGPVGLSSKRAFFSRLGSAWTRSRSARTRSAASRSSRSRQLPSGKKSQVAAEEKVVAPCSPLRCSRLTWPS